MKFRTVVEAAQALITAAGLGHAVATADIKAAATDLSQQWGDHQVRKIEDDISKEIRRRGGTTTSQW